jgi:hypothetical protein
LRKYNQNNVILNRGKTMAPRTISQIAGEFGLARGAASDPFAQQETAVLSNVQRTLEDIRSNAEETASAKGFGRSSFTEGVIQRKEADVFGQVGAQFAQARTADALAEKQFERGIISEELGADRSSRALTESVFAEKELIGARATSETGLIGARGAEQRTTLADQIAGQASLSTQQASQREQEIQQQQAAESGLIGTRSSASIDEIQAKAVSSSQLITQEAQEKRLTLADQSAAAIEQINAAAQGREALAVTGGEQARQTQAENYIEQGKIVNQQAQARLDEINANFEKESQLLTERFDRIRADLPFELQQKARYEKEILEKELEVRREQNMIDTVIQTSLSYVLGNLSTEGGIGTGLANILDDLAGDLF